MAGLLFNSSVTSPFFQEVGISEACWISLLRSTMNYRNLSETSLSIKLVTLSRPGADSDFSVWIAVFSSSYGELFEK